MNANTLRCFGVLCLLIFSLGMAFPFTDQETPLAEELSSILAKQEAAWNRGDLEDFMGAYWNSEKLTFSSGGTTQRGWDATLTRYQKSYPDKETMGKLTFSKLEVEALGAEAALMLGRWHLDREEPAQGNFSLVWRKISGKWVIVHDHSSKEE
ncbi:MAG: nuclear transport factor 2 family protein [Planctomycetota bacterium]